MSTMVDDPRLIVERGGIAGLPQLAVRRLRQGELGPLPVIFGLIIITIVFQTSNDHFLSYLNLTNIATQIAAGGVISVGVVLVLLLGEIDLSVGYVSGFCSAVMAVLTEKHGWPGPLAVLAAIAVGVAVGLFIGLVRTKLQVPSFVVTLAGFIAFQGALLYTLGSNGSINVGNSFVVDLANKLLPLWLGWALAVVVIAVSVGSGLLGVRRRLAAGLRPPSTTTLVLRYGVISIGVLVVVFVLSQDRRVNQSPLFPPIQGVPLGVVIFLGILVLFHFVTQRTRFGRHLYAVGGNEEAARRAGIGVDNVRLAVFILSSTLAACGGILAASRGLNVNQNSGGGDILLDAIAAAVIGGTSLFGGRGYVWSALLGWLVIGFISSGMDLLSLQTSVKFMITGGVLLAAVVVDALSRRGRAAAGRV